MKNLIYLSIIVLLGCKSTSDFKEPQKFDLKTISKGLLFGNGVEKIEKNNFVIKNEKDWEELQKKMNTVNNVSSSFKEIPVDFKNEMILCVFDELRNTGGYSIEIVQISSNKKELNVLVGLTKPKPTDMVTTAFTQPYHIAKTQKTKREVVFKIID